MAFIDKVNTWFNGLWKDPIPFDPSTIEDPIAARTQWTAIEKNGAARINIELKQVDEHSIEIESTFRAKYGPLASMLVPFAFFGFFGFDMEKEYFGFFSSGIHIFIIVWLIISSKRFYRATAYRAVFDKRTGTFYRSGLKPEWNSISKSVKHTQLNEIHALQLIHEVVDDDNSSFSSYEINVVLKDGSRVNVMDHGDSNYIRSDADRIAKFLDVPIWDASDFKV